MTHASTTTARHPKKIPSFLFLDMPDDGLENRRVKYSTLVYLYEHSSSWRQTPHRSRKRQWWLLHANGTVVSQAVGDPIKNPVFWRVKVNTGQSFSSINFPTKLTQSQDRETFGIIQSHKNLRLIKDPELLYECMQYIVMHDACMVLEKKTGSCLSQNISMLPLTLIPSKRGITGGHT